MVDDVKNYIKTCQKCQQQGKIFKRISPELQSLPIDAKVMQQVGVDLGNLPEVNGCKHLIVLIDQFSKWSEAKPVKDKSAPTVARFLYEVMCRHGYFKTQINDQGKEFVNEVSDVLLELTGTDQRVTSGYHPQSNGLCERQNRTIKAKRNRRCSFCTQSKCPLLNEVFTILFIIQPPPYLADWYKVQPGQGL